MQKKACHEFAAKQNNWIIVKEFYEKGVSGFSVYADDRDEIIKLRNAAFQHEFDVLLVFMFDRLGRREDESPFILKWFVEQGVEVWSVKEEHSAVNRVVAGKSQPVEP
ncbi:MAG: recombinase family protein [Bacillus sp. (in: Bacteria)]|nr:recombinase family protein [Bacillus sp. (in: firmicutes)]